MKISPYIVPGIFTDSLLTLEEEMDLFASAVVQRHKAIFVPTQNRSIPITKYLMFTKHRYSGLTYLRQMFIYYIRTKRSKVRYTYSDIARFFEVDHTTVLYGYNSFKSQLSVNSELPSGLTSVKCNVVEDYEAILRLIEKAKYKL